ncbi:MAG: murein transglycosylase A [Saprospiraceae bacterium]
MFKRTLLVLLCFIITVACNSQNSQTELKKSENSLDFNTFNDGRDSTAKVFRSTYEIRTAPETWDITLVSQTFTALDKSFSYLNRKKKRTHKVGNLSISDYQLLKANQSVKSWANGTSDKNLFEAVNAYQIAGEDNRGNVQVTGYFIPIIQVKRTKDEVYKYPLYKKPSSSKSRYSRKQIDDNNALSGLGLELCYSASLLDNFLMQVQGSGFVQYTDGTTQLLSYGGENGHRYKSIGKYLVAAGHVPESKISLEAIRVWCAENPDSVTTLLNRNPSYVYFNTSEKEPSGAAGVALTGMVSVAVDKRYIPLGSTLLAAVPVLDENDEFVGHEYRIVTAQDVGGAIKGKGRMDFFCGTGEAGERRASAMKHYGKVWLLLPK